MSEVSPTLADVLGAVALFATSNTALIALLAASRVLYGMARGRDAPPALGKVLRGRDTPWVASLTVMIGALILLPLGGVAFIGSVASLAALLAFVVVNACCIQLRLDQPRAERPFRVPLSIRRVPVLPTAGMALAIALVTQFEAVVYLIVAGVLVAAFGVYAIRTASSD